MAKFEGLTAHQQSFVEEYFKLKCTNAAQAYRNSLYKSDGMNENTLNVEVNKLLNHPKIAPIIKDYKAKAAKKVAITAERAVQEATRRALFDVRKMYDEKGQLKPIHELDDETAAAIAGVDHTGRIIFCNKDQNLERLFKHLGLYEKDNQQQVERVVQVMGKVIVNGKPLNLDIGEDPDEPGDKDSNREES